MQHDQLKPSLESALIGTGMESGRAGQMAGNPEMRSAVMDLLMRHIKRQNPAPSFLDVLLRKPEKPVVMPLSF
jgi:hypothetical protein